MRRSQIRLDRQVIGKRRPSFLSRLRSIIRGTGRVSERHEHLPDRCCACDALARVVAFSNAHHYCPRCAEEVRALGWAVPA